MSVTCSTAAPPAQAARCLTCTCLRPRGPGRCGHRCGAEAASARGPAATRRLTKWLLRRGGGPAELSMVAAGPGPAAGPRRSAAPRLGPSARPAGGRGSGGALPAPPPPPPPPAGAARSAGPHPPPLPLRAAPRGVEFRHAPLGPRRRLGGARSFATLPQSPRGAAARCMPGPRRTVPSLREELGAAPAAMFRRAAAARGL